MHWQQQRHEHDTTDQHANEPEDTTNNDAKRERKASNHHTNYDTTLGNGLTGTNDHATSATSPDQSCKGKSVKRVIIAHRDANHQSETHEREASTWPEGTDEPNPSPHEGR